MNVSCAQRLRNVLELPAWQDAQVEELVAEAAPRLWRAALARCDEALSDQQMQSIHSHLADMLHWALHLGQAATKLLAHEQSRSSDRDALREWWSAIERLFQRPLIMVGDDDDGLLGILNILRLQTSDVQASTWGVKEPKAHLMFTAARLRDDCRQQHELDGEDSVAYVESVLKDHISGLAHLYVRNLEWLFCSAEQDDVATVDCFVSICAIALSMSGDALRMLWQV